MERLGTWEEAGEPLTLARLTEAGEVAALLDVFQDIASEQGWQPGEALDAAPERAAHFALIGDDAPVGGLQVVLPDAPGGLPCRAVWPDAELSPGAAHVTIIGIRARYRGRIELFWALCHALWCFCADRGIADLALEATPRMVAVYRRIGLPLKQVGDLRTHWGEPCHLAAVDVAEVAGQVVLRARRSPLFRRLVLDALPPLGAPVMLGPSLPRP